MVTQTHRSAKCWRRLLAAGVAAGVLITGLVPAVAVLKLVGPPASAPDGPADATPVAGVTAAARTAFDAIFATVSRRADAADELRGVRSGPAVGTPASGTGLVQAPEESACVGADASAEPGSLDYLTCVSREATLVLVDPLIDFNLRLLQIAASVNDSRSLSLIGNLIAFGGTCIVGFTPLGNADTRSSSNPEGTASSSRGSGTVPITIVELAYVSLPTDPAERPAAGVAVAAAVTPDGDAHSSGAVNRDRAQSEANASAPGLGVAVATHSEDLLDGQPGLPEPAVTSPASR